MSTSRALEGRWWRDGHRGDTPTSGPEHQLRRTTMRHLGILAHSTEGAALCFLEFCRHGFADLGERDHPDVTLDCIALARSMPLWESGATPGSVRLGATAPAGSLTTSLTAPSAPTTPHTWRSGSRALPALCPGCTSARSSPTRPSDRATARSACSGRATRWTARCTPTRSAVAGSRRPSPTRRTESWSTTSSLESCWTASCDPSRERRTSGSSSSWPARAATPWRWCAPRSRCWSRRTCRRSRPWTPPGCSPRRPTRSPSSGPRCRPGTEAPNLS